MRAIANPVEVQYAVITEIVGDRSPDFMIVTLDWGDHQHQQMLSRGQLARFVPHMGDYFVRQSDGYEYLNPREVFERKYHPVRTREQLEAWWNRIHEIAPFAIASDPLLQGITKSEIAILRNIVDFGDWWRDTEAAQ